MFFLCDDYKWGGTEMNSKIASSGFLVKGNMDKTHMWFSFKKILF